MESMKVCVNCGNKKAVNDTNNRLVTESCGHVKCIQCLLQETSGCIACKETENGKSVVKKTSSKGQKERRKAKVGSECLGIKGDTPTIKRVKRDVILDNESEDSSEPEQADSTHKDDNAEELASPALYKEMTKVTQSAEDVKEIKKEKLNVTHIKVEQEGYNKYYTCTVCNRKFTARSQIKYHAYCNGQKKPYQCDHPDCKDKNPTFATHSHYEYHMLTHRGERPHVCEVCNATFIQKSKLDRHKLKHAKAKKYPCEDCGKAFNEATSLRRHLRTHTGERPYTCKDCGLRFRDPSNYNKHVKKHLDKKCVCSLCGRTALGTRGLSAHVATHERRPHQCPRCPQAFYKRTDMRRHALVHLDRKPWNCGLCPSKFRRKDNLERHMRTTHAQHDDDEDGDTATAGVDLEPTDTVLNGTKSPVNLTQEGKHNSDEINEKAKLEVLNPLPPLPKEVIQKHLYTETKPEERIIDKSYIIEANNARKSVIVGNVLERKVPSPVTEYVHKIRKANSLSCQKEVRLPPINPRKFLQLVTEDLDVGPLPKNIQPYKNILDNKIEKSEEKVHWKKYRRLTETE